MIENLRNAIKYNPDTGMFIRIDGCPYAKKGWFAGSINDKGYRTIKVLGNNLSAHRLGWALTYGEWPDLIDHINGDKSDNRLCNLRVATKNQNQYNRKRSKGKKLPKGVYASNKSKTYRAEIKANGKCHHLGMFETPEAASRAYIEASKSMHGAYARHDIPTKPGADND